MNTGGVGLLAKRRVHRPCGEVVRDTLKGAWGGQHGWRLVSWGGVAVDEAEEGRVRSRWGGGVVGFGPGMMGSQWRVERNVT